MEANSIFSRNHDLYSLFISGLFCQKKFHWPAAADENSFISYFLQQTRRDSIQLLIHDEVSTHPEWKQWPSQIRHTFEEAAKNDAIIDILRQQDLVSLLEFFQELKIEPILLKGAALSLSHYPKSYLRTRSDTDLLIPFGTLPQIQPLLIRKGYETVLIEGELINHQQVFKSKSPQGLICLYDIHHKLLNPQHFSDTLSYKEILQESTCLSLLGQNVKIISDAHALLHACMHRVAHHYEEQKLIWLYDIHLLLTGKTEAWLQNFYELAAAKKMRKVCGVSFQLCQKWFNTAFPEDWLRQFVESTAPEPSQSFLDYSPTTFSIFRENFFALPHWKQKVKLLQEIFFPTAEYLKQKYQITSPLFVPFLYGWRMISGIPRIFRKVGTGKNREES